MTFDKPKYNRIAAILLVIAIVVISGAAALHLTMSVPDEKSLYYWLLLGLGMGLALGAAAVIVNSLFAGMKRQRSGIDAHDTRAIGAISASMAHDLNNLLLVLSMEASRLEELGDRTPELRESVAALNQVVEEGRSIADKLMSLAQGPDS